MIKNSDYRGLIELMSQEIVCQQNIQEMVPISLLRVKGETT
jgi:hypothetical protein